MLRYLIPALAISISLSSPAHAQDTTDYRASVGVLGGIGFIWGLDERLGGLEPDDSNFTLAAKAGFAAAQEWDLGVYGQWIHLVHEEPAGAPDVDFRLWSLLGEGNYRFSERLKGFFAGGKVGIGIVDGTGVDATTRLAFGPAVGYDYRFEDKSISVGGEANWIFIQTDDAFSTLSLLAAVKYWF